MRTASASYRNALGAARAAGSFAWQNPKTTAAIAAGTVAGARALKRKVGSMTADLPSRISGASVKSPLVLCSNPRCRFNATRTDASKFIRRSSSLDGRYELIFCNACGMVLGSFKP